MKLLVNGNDLSNAVMKVSKAISVKTTNPILEGIKMTVKGDELTLSATDMEIAIEKTIKTDTFEEGVSVVPGKLFAELGLLADADLALKVKVLAAVEYAELNTYNNLPIFYSVANSLNSAKIRNGADTYLGPMIGYGGIRHLTYNYTDEEWTAFVQSNSGNLENIYRG